MNKYGHLEFSDWMQTYSGIPFVPSNPRIQDIRIADIAHALSMICRYTGHTLVFYSVAEHSIIMSRMVPEEYKLEALLHDATEAYLNDIAKPMKRFLPEYQTYERNLDEIIRHAYSLPKEVSDVIKEADIRMLETEHEQLMGELAVEGWEWTTTREGVEPFDVELFAMQPGHAENVFLGEFKKAWDFHIHNLEKE